MKVMVLAFSYIESGSLLSYSKEPRWVNQPYFTDGRFGLRDGGFIGWWLLSLRIILMSKIIEKYNISFAVSTLFW